MRRVGSGSAGTGVPTRGLSRPIVSLYASGGHWHPALRQGRQPRRTFCLLVYWVALSERYTTQQLMDVVFTVGQYNMVSISLNSFGVQLDNGVAGF